MRGPSSLPRLLCCLLAAAPLLAGTPAALRGEIYFSEVMFSPTGADSIWEWVEIKNAGNAAIDLHGWIFDDDGDSHFAASNIDAANGNTMVPAGGVAVLYNGAALGFDPLRFAAAWTPGLTLIPVQGFTALAVSDTIGLWPSHEAYMSDALMSSTAPRRTFDSAVVSFNYSAANGFPTVRNGRSLAWRGEGSPASGAHWVESSVGELGAVASVETMLPLSAINSAEDRGNPGVVPGGPRAAGLLITEVMFNPRSPAVATGYSEADFEWIEILNNGAAAIDFAATPYVLDDVAGAALSAANVTSGTLAVGEVGVLFNNNRLTADDMAAMWGGDIKFIEVESWPLLNNGAETIALWDSLAKYLAEPETGPGRTHEYAAAALSYQTLAGQGWPTMDDRSSIFLQTLTGDPNVGANWARSGSSGDELGSWTAMEIFQVAVDHPGGDIGSPGYVAGPTATPVNPGDYNQDGIVDAADYTVWRDNLGRTVALPNEAATLGTVTAEDFDVWRANFGNRTLQGAAAADSVAIPEAASLTLALSASVAVLGRLRRRRREPR